MNRNITWLRLLTRQFGSIDSDRKARSVETEMGAIFIVPVGASTMFTSAGFPNKVYSTMVTPYASSCSCPDHIHRLVACKHIIALAEEMDQRRITVDQRLLRVTVVDQGQVDGKSIPFDEAIARMELLGSEGVRLVLGTPLILASRPVQVEWEVA